MLNPYKLQGRRVLVAGHDGMVGTALVRRLEREKCKVLTVLRSEVDIREPTAVRPWIEAARPPVGSGGILASESRPAKLVYDNLTIKAIVTGAARRAGVGKILFLGPSPTCPKLAVQSIAEADPLPAPSSP